MVKRPAGGSSVQQGFPENLNPSFLLFGLSLKSKERRNDGK
jgi:hypothetical protein